MSLFRHRSIESTTTRSLSGFQPCRETLLKCTPSAAFCFTAPGEGVKLTRPLACAGPILVTQRCVKLTTRIRETNNTIREFFNTCIKNICRDNDNIAGLCRSDLEEKEKGERERNRRIDCDLYLL